MFIELKKFKVYQKVYFLVMSVYLNKRKQRGSYRKMFEIRNGRILIAGASLELPNKLYLDTEKSKEKKLVFSDKNRCFCVEVQQVNKSFPAPIIIEKGLKRPSIRLIKDVAVLTLNGLSGYYAIYSKSSKEYYKAWLKKETSAVVYLILTISIKRKRGNIKKIMSEKEIMSVFWNLCVE